MALKPLYHNRTPMGVFDALDSEVTAFKGGEVVTLTYVDAFGSDKASADVKDGYVSESSQLRPAVTKSLVSGKRPLFLADEGTSGYGTLFGVVVGGSSGQDMTGIQVGPHTAYPSGKVTLWDTGLFAVTLDAVDPNANVGLQKTNASLAGGAALYATVDGLLTPNAAAAFEAVTVARFIEFTTNGSLVRTPADLVTGNTVFTQAVINFRIEE
jgi:hypothetical protein